jgi:hypothetical protein
VNTLNTTQTRTPRIRAEARRAEGLQENGFCDLKFTPDENLTQRLQLLIWCTRRWLCQRLCGDAFFNHDASLTIDQLTLENEQLRARVAEAERV